MEEIIFQKILQFLEEDMPFGDITTDILIPRKIVRAKVINKEDCVVAGNRFITPFLDKMGIEVEASADDGVFLKAGSIVLAVKGDARRILYIERTVLNLLMILSGIATYTRRLVEKVRQVNPRIRIAATRKTPPGLRFLVKYAVEVGGGDAHRLSLSDMALIKDNHLKIAGGVGEAVSTLRSRLSFSKKIEIEVSSVHQAVEAAKAGADIIMCDNMSPEGVAEVINTLQRLGLRSKVMIEVSGGITEDNIVDYAKIDVDVISLSKITLNAPPVDMSLEVEV